MQPSKPLTHSDLQQFTGDLERFQHQFNRRVIYTPGVQYLAEKAGAYWLIDAIASYIGSPQLNEAIALDERLSSLQFWRVEVTGNQATLSCRADSDAAPVITQAIEYTDFPLAYIDVWAGFDGRYWTFYLPSEH